MCYSSVKSLLVGLLILATFAHSDTITTSTGDQQQQQGAESARGGCGSCQMREELKSRNLEAIKGEVLRRMGFQTAPNITGRVLPQVPAHILAKVDGAMMSGGAGAYSGMQSDEPQDFEGPTITEEEDDFHIKTETVLTFAQPCKLCVCVLIWRSRTEINANQCVWSGNYSRDQPSDL